jgi:hypothetical protein
MLPIVLVGLAMFGATCRLGNQAERIAKALEGIQALEVEAKEASKK